MKLREITRADWPTLLELNLASVRELSELDERRLESLLSWAQRGLAVESDRAIVAFALAIAPGAAYDSDNYRWFGARFERFLYLDRIVVSDAMRRRGIGGQLYDAMEATAVGFERMVCEVNLRPPNEASLAFHTSRGYIEIGRLEHAGGKVVALLTKELAAPARHPPVRLPR
ncbi:MAG: GNAT family N-acetyltransferase [Solirubrobacterales bacterium]